jgi:hypothetical protein
VHKLAVSLAILAVAPALVGNAAHVWAAQNEAMAPFAGALIVGVGIFLALAGRVVAGRLADRPEFLEGPKRFVVAIASWRVMVAMLAVFALAFAGVRPAVTIVSVIFDLAFWTCVCSGVAMLAPRALVVCALALYAVSRTSAIGAVLILDDDLASWFSLAHRGGAVIAAFALALVFVIIARRPPEQTG